MTKEELLKVIQEAAASEVETLNLTGKNITELPPEIGQLTRLRGLDLTANKLTTLPPEIGQLTNLRKLFLGGNGFASIPAEVAKLIQLEVLYLHVNLLSEFPPELCQLPNLESITLDNNKLTTLPPQINLLTNLRYLYVSNNKLVTLPQEIVQLSNLTLLYLRDNPLPIPPEILEKADEPAAIINYYFEHLSGRKKPLNEAKMLVVGQGSVGKTSLVKRLVGEQFNPRENKTEGINIQKWGVKVDGRDVRLNVWDFGGQEIMHATHQFFLTKRSLYVLVVDARVSEEDNRVEYWLKVIQSFGKDSPVIIVGNKVDQQRLDLNRSRLQEKYPNIKAFVETSCPSGEGVEELKAVVMREVGALAHIHDPLLVSWFAVKERLEEMKEDYIPYHEYVRLCRAENIADEQSQSTLIGFLHDLGIVLNFRDDPRLEDTNILNPEWVTNGVYKILNSHILFQSKGVLDRQSLGGILNLQKYPKEKHIFIMDMMRKFELCFDFEGMRDEQFLIPDLLTREETDTGDWTGALAFQYHYSVLPTSIISRFIVRMHQSISKNTLWRTGVVLKNNGNKALVKADIEDRKIFIWVSGSKDSRRRFLEVIRSHFDSIHKTIPGIVADEKVPLASHPEIAVDYKHLLRLELKGITDWIPEGLEETVNVKQLLDGIETEQARKRRQEGRLKEERPERLSMHAPPDSHETKDAGAIAELTRIKDNLDLRSESYAKRRLWWSLALLAAMWIVLAALTYRFTWDVMEPWITFLGGGVTVLTYGYFAITQREWTPTGIYNHIVERKKKQNYLASGFDPEKYERLVK